MANHGSLYCSNIGHINLNFRDFLRSGFLDMREMLPDIFQHFNLQILKFGKVNIFAKMFNISATYVGPGPGPGPGAGPGPCKVYVCTYMYVYVYVFVYVYVYVY